jgi:menaquinone-dependent protoporphyrinogen oxidase
VYGTTEGQTRKIALYLKGILQDEGHIVSIADATTDPPSPEDYDSVLIGGSVHMHKYQSAVAHYIRRYARELNKIPGAFFSVCLAVASGLEEEKKEAKKITGDFLEHVGWKPSMIVQIAGALKYTEYDFFKRLVMKMIAKREGHPTDTSKDYEYTDWKAVKEFACDFASVAAHAL